MSERDQLTAATSDTLIDQVADWLIMSALDGADVETLFSGCCERLHAADIPLMRGSIGFNTLHPLFSGVTLRWRPNTGLERESFRHGELFDDDSWEQSPLAAVLKSNAGFFRRRLNNDKTVADYPLLKEFRDDGATDYYMIATPFSDAKVLDYEKDGMMASWLTDHPNGFSDREIDALTRIQKRLAVACKVTIKEQVAHNVLDAYLGRNAGARVLSGQIKLGDGEEINAVIWFSDLRGSTPLADASTKPEFLLTLNDYFEVTAGAVIANGGEVLRFIGDAVLAIFPIDDGMTAQAAASAAVAALCEADKRLIAVNERRQDAGKPEIAFGAGLHMGEVLYGNIGVPERVEFSVIGAAANEAARIESLTKSLDCHALASKAFVELAPDGWTSVGHHALRGVGDEIEIFAVSDISKTRRTADA